MAESPSPSGAAPAWARDLGDGNWQLFIRVQPGAKKSEVMGEQEGRLRLRIAAQAVDNKANKAVLAFVAKQLGVRPNRLSIVLGETGRQKIVLLTDTPLPSWKGLYGVEEPGISPR